MLDGAPGELGLLDGSGVPEGEVEEEGGVAPEEPVEGGVVGGVPGLVILSLEPDLGAADLSASRLQPAAARVSTVAATSVRACLIMSGLL